MERRTRTDGSIKSTRALERRMVGISSGARQEYYVLYRATKMRKEEDFCGTAAETRQKVMRKLVWHFAGGGGGHDRNSAYPRSDAKFVRGNNGAILL